jgi:hypothetical protein
MEICIFLQGYNPAGLGLYSVAAFDLNYHPNAQQSCWGYTCPDEFWRDRIGEGGRSHPGTILATVAASKPLMWE